MLTTFENFELTLAYERSRYIRNTSLCIPLTPFESLAALCLLT